MKAKGGSLVMLASRLSVSSTESSSDLLSSTACFGFGTVAVPGACSTDTADPPDIFRDAFVGVALAKVDFEGAVLAGIVREKSALLAMGVAGAIGNDSSFLAASSGSESESESNSDSEPELDSGAGSGSISASAFEGAPSYLRDAVVFASMLLVGFKEGIGIGVRFTSLVADIGVGVDITLT